MYKKILTIILFLPAVIVVGQSRIIPQPVNKVINLDGNWIPNSSLNVRYWYVTSDRNNNQVFSDDGFGNPIQDFKLRIGEAVWVLEYKPGVGFEVTRPSNVNASMVFTGTPNAKGWVKEETMVISKYNLRISQNPLLPGKRGLYSRKAFISNRPGVFRPPVYYADPELSDSIDVLNILTVLYVYKEIGNSVLLGNAPEKASFEAPTIVGWVNRSTVASWNHNMVLEKNWDREAVEERSGKDLPAMVFSDFNDAIRWSDGVTYFQKPILYNEKVDSVFRFQSKREPANVFRRPIIAPTSKESVFEVGYLSQTFTSISDAEKTKLLTCIKDLLDQLNTINLILLIDGTHSIYPYKNTIIENLKQASGQLIQIVTGSGGEITKKIQYNAVIYRDEPYQVPFAIMKDDGSMSSNYNDLLNFINREMVQSPPLRVGTDDQPEALFHGLRIVTKHIRGIRPFEKTFVIVIGDTGDHQDNTSRKSTYYTINQMIDSLNLKNYSVSAIQIANNPKPVVPADSYSRFQNQFKQILKGYYNKRYGIVLTDAEESPNATTKKFPLDNFNIPSMIIYPTSGNQLSQNAVGEYLRKIITDAPFVDFKVKLPCPVPNIGIRTSDPLFTQKVLYALLNYYYVEGYNSQLTKVNNESNSFKFFKDVQYFEDRELENIRRQLNTLIPPDGAVGSQSPKTRLFNSWKEILVRRLKIVDENSFNNVSLQEAGMFLTQSQGRQSWDRIMMRDISNNLIFDQRTFGEYYFDWFITKVMVQSVLERRSFFTQSFLNQHKNVFVFCYEYITGNRLPTGPARESRIRELIQRTLTAYGNMNYNRDDYIQNIARCKGETFSIVVKDDGSISQGKVTNMYWVPGDYFPHENNIASIIFN